MYIRYIQNAISYLFTQVKVQTDAILYDTVGQMNLTLLKPKELS